jgi:hypothetical protein
MASAPAPDPALQVVGGAVSGGWRDAGGPDLALAAAPTGGGYGVVAAVVLSFIVLGGLLLPAGFRGRDLGTVRVSVGPWPDPPSSPRAEVVLVLLSGGPLPLDADGEIRWVRDGEQLRLGPGAGCVRRARPLRTEAVWMHLCPRGASVEDPAVRP